MVLRFASCGDWGVVWCGGTCVYLSVWFQYQSHAVNLSSNHTNLILNPPGKGFFMKSDL